MRSDNGVKNAQRNNRNLLSCKKIVHIILDIQVLEDLYLDLKEDR